MGVWRVRYDGTCARCGKALLRGTPAISDRSTKTIRCIECPDDSAATTDATVPDAGAAGRSARNEFDRRVAKRDAAITERWGTGFASKVVKALTDEPQSTRSWASGAAGEEKLARVLADVPGIRVLHDRRVPGTRGNIDHIVVASGGVFVIDAKNHHGFVDIKNRGSLLRPDWRLTVGGRDCTAMVENVGWQVGAVADALQGLAQPPPITPVLCFLEADWPLISRPDEFQGVRLESPRTLQKRLTRIALLSENAIADVYAIIGSRLLPR